MQRSMRLVLRVVGAGLLLATGAIHLDLYLTGYRTIPTIGWLFLLQVITAFGLGLLVLATANRLVSAAGAAFSASTLAGYLLSLDFGLFGFREVRTSAGIVAGVIEVVGFIVLAALALSPSTARPHAESTIRALFHLDLPRRSLLGARWAATGLSILAGVLLITSLMTTSPTTNTSSGALLKLTKIHGVGVITDAHGYTLYWFVPDTSTKSTCYGTCAVYWPPVIGSPSADPGVTGTLGTVTRTGGATQATYDGHPLYTYVGDSKPGQANGNNINLNGGVWHEMAASG
jgi:predicted lipoprotein with Yx(FWY)xxD motif